MKKKVMDCGEFFSTAIYFIVSFSTMTMSPGARKGVQLLSRFLVAAGALGFCFLMGVRFGTFGQLRGVAWPVGYTSDAIRLPDGRYAVPLMEISRVQVYSADLRFENGWQVETEGGNFTLSSAPGGKLGIYTARGEHHYIFDPDGTLLASYKYDRESQNYPSPGRDAVSVNIGSPLLAIALGSPIFSVLPCAVGMLIANMAEKKDLQDALR
jgi:hypothetical protein